MVLDEEKDENDDGTIFPWPVASEFAFKLVLNPFVDATAIATTKSAKLVTSFILCCFAQLEEPLFIRARNFLPDGISADYRARKQVEWQK